MCVMDNCCLKVQLLRNGSCTSRNGRDTIQYYSSGDPVLGNQHQGAVDGRAAKDGVQVPEFDISVHQY